MIDDFGMDDQARCGECGSRLEIVRPGKYQCPTCDALGAMVVELERSAMAWGAACRTGYDFDTPIGIHAYQRLQTARKAVMAHMARLRADVARIGRERDQMIAANVELQVRLSALEDDLK